MSDQSHIINSLDQRIAYLAKLNLQREARIAELEALIADAPHEEWCNVVLTGPRQDCDCWKSRALDTGEKG